MRSVIEKYAKITNLIDFYYLTLFFRRIIFRTFMVLFWTDEPIIGMVVSLEQMTSPTMTAGVTLRVWRFAQQTLRQATREDAFAQSSRSG